MKLLRFICPSCKHFQLEEIMTDAIVVSKISFILFDDGEANELPEYNLDHISDGYVNRYQCSHCGYTLKDKAGVIDTSERAVEWLKGQEYNNG